MTGLFKAIRSIATALGLTAVLALAGCGYDGVELNGKIFDVMGVSGKGNTTEPTMANRTGLVVPPNVQALPPPGSQPNAAAADVAALQDPDRLQNVSMEEKRRQQAAYCKVHYEDAKFHGDPGADLAEGPLGPCRHSALSALEKWQKGGDDEE